jgi:hypothetical protein
MNVVEFVKAHPYWSGGIALVTFVLIWYLMSGSSETTTEATSTGTLSGDTEAAAELAAAQIAANASTAVALAEAGASVDIAALSAGVDKAAIEADKAVALGEQQSLLDLALAEYSALVGIEAYSSQTEIAKSNNEAAIAFSTNAAAVQISENEVASTEFTSLAALLGDYAKTNSVAGILEAYAPIAESQASLGGTDTSNLYSLSGIQQGLLSIFGGGSAKSSGGSSYNTNTASQGGGGGAYSSVSGSSWGGFLSNTSLDITSDPTKTTLSSNKFTDLFNTLANKLTRTRDTTNITTPTQATLDLAKTNLGALKDYKYTPPAQS